MLAIAGGKGGCGKTTTALGLARALAEFGYTPLVVDADSDMPDIHHMADIDHRVLDATRHVDSGRTIDSSRQTTRLSGVDAVATGYSFEDAVQYTDAFPGVGFLTAGRRETTIHALRQCQNWPGPVIIDTPAGISPDATRPLAVADTALVLSTDEPQCLEDTTRTATACTQFGTHAVGVIREVVGSSPTSLGDVPVIGLLPTVAVPFQSKALTDAFEELARHLEPLVGS